MRSFTVTAPASDSALIFSLILCVDQIIDIFLAFSYNFWEELMSKERKTNKVKG